MKRRTVLTRPGGGDVVGLGRRCCVGSNVGQEVVKPTVAIKVAGGRTHPAAVLVQ